MASATVDSAVATPEPSEPPLLVDAIPTVDLRCLSQSELYSLSRCSPSSFDPLRCDDVVIPKIDRSVFNESAGSRKQTYSRLRLAPASSAASSAASPSSLRRRTPHLRHTSNLPYHYLNSDPEKGENQQILALFKQLFGLDSSVCVNEVSPEELVPIRVDYSDSLPQFVNEPLSVPQPSNVQSLGQKRKRGRPRKNENVPLLLVDNKVESQLSPCIINENSVGTTNNQVVVLENVEQSERDKEIVNKDGVEVDLVALGAMHDPYEPELMRRTRGMGTEEELLEFLKGLDGRWGSRRRKRRIVDANEFGNVLPNGWSLLLSVKKKEGHVWLFCRRYISPNAQQFETCKEISSYLLTLRGIQDTNQLPCPQSNTFTETVSSMGFDKTVDLAAGGQAGEVNPACQVVSSAVGPEATNFQAEVTLKTGDLPAVQVGEVLHCDKCNSSFASQNDYFQHQLSSHRRKKPRSGESITDGVIIKDGKFECQFCHKTFIERHRYNGHIGAHVRYQGKGSDESQGPPAFDLIPQGTVAETSVGSESNAVAEILRTDADYVMSPYSPSSVSKQYAESKESNDKGGGVYEAMDVDVDVTKSSLSFIPEAVLENRNNDDCSESLDGANIIRRVVGTDIGTGNPGGAEVTKRIADEIEVGNSKSFDMPGMGTKSFPSFPLDGKTGGNEIKVSGISVDMEEARQKVVHGSDLHGSKENLGSFEIDLDDVHLSRRSDELRFEGEKFVSNVSVSDFDDKHGGLHVSSGIGDREHFESEAHLFKNGDNLDDKSIYPVLGSEQNTGSGYSSTGVAFEHENMYAFVSKECGNTGKPTKDTSTSLQNKGVIGGSTVHLSLNEQVNFADKYDNEVSSCFVDGNEQLKDSESSLPSFSAFDMCSGLEQYVDGVSARQMEEPKVSDVHYVTNDELSFPFSSSNNPKKMDTLRNNKHERRLEFRSFFPSENAEDGVTNFHKNVVEANKSQHLLAESLIAGASHETYVMENIYATQAEESKLINPGNSKSEELCLASDSRPNCNSVALEQYPAQSFDVESGMKQIIGVQSNLNIDSNIGPVNPKVRAFDFDLDDSAFSDRAYGFGNNINMIYPGKVWEGPKIGEVGNSSRKFMVGFDGSNAQRVEDVMSGGIWRTGEENMLHAGSSISSTPPVQSANCFRNFDIISDKGEDLYGVNQKYDGGIGFEGLTLGRTEPVEYSFMTSQSTSSLPGESKGFQYDVNTGQGFDSSFWLGREALMPNVSVPNQESTVCVWCRNEFYQEPIPTGAQTGGAIGSMCPDCSSKVSRQFNI